MAGFLIPFGNMLGEAGAGVSEGKDLQEDHLYKHINNQLLSLQLQQSVSDEKARNELLNKLKADPSTNPMMLLAVQTGNKDLLTYFAKQGASENKAALFEQKAADAYAAGDKINGDKWRAAAKDFRTGMDFNQSMVMSGLPNTAYVTPENPERKGQEIQSNIPIGYGGGVAPAPAYGSGAYSNIKNPEDLAKTAAQLDQLLKGKGVSEAQRKSIIANVVYGGSPPPAGGSSGTAGPAPIPAPTPTPAPGLASGSSEASNEALRKGDFGAWLKANPHAKYYATPGEAEKQFMSERAALRKEEKPIDRIESDDGIHVNLIRMDRRTLKTIAKVPFGEKAVPVEMQKLAQNIREATGIVPQLEAAAKAIGPADVKQFLADYSYYNSPGWLKAMRFGYKMRPNNARLIGLAGTIMAKMSGAYGGAAKSVRLYQTLLNHIPDPGDNPTTIMDKINTLRAGALKVGADELRDVYNNPIYYAPGVGTTPLNPDDEKLLGEAGLGGP